MAGLPHADQGGLPVPRFDPGRAHRARSRAVPGFGATRGHARHTGMAELLFQIADDGAATLSRARPVHPVDEAEEHAALDGGRRPDHPPGPGVLRLSGFPGAVGTPLRLPPLTCNGLITPGYRPNFLF